MRIPLPKSKLVTLAIVAVVGSGLAAAALASPGLWGQTADGAGPEPAAGLQSFLPWDDERGDDEREEHEEDEHDEHEDDD